MGAGSGGNVVVALGRSRIGTVYEPCDTATDTLRTPPRNLGVDSPGLNLFRAQAEWRAESSF